MPALAGIYKSAAITYSRIATTIGRTVFTIVFGMVTRVSLYVWSPQKLIYLEPLRCQDVELKASKNVNSPIIIRGTNDLWGRTLAGHTAELDHDRLGFGCKSNSRWKLVLRLERAELFEQGEVLILKLHNAVSSRFTAHKT